jgi:hypothetical protein
MTEQQEPEVGDFILLFDDESEAAGEPPILLVRVIAEARARFLAYEKKARAWRLVGEGYKLLLPYAPVKDVH